MGGKPAMEQWVSFTASSYIRKRPSFIYLTRNKRPSPIKRKSPKLTRITSPHKRSVNL